MPSIEILPNFRHVKICFNFILLLFNLNLFVARGWSLIWGQFNYNLSQKCLLLNELCRNLFKFIKAHTIMYKLFDSVLWKGNCLTANILYIYFIPKSMIY